MKKEKKNGDTKRKAEVVGKVAAGTSDRRGAGSSKGQVGRGALRNDRGRDRSGSDTRTKGGPREAQKTKGAIPEEGIATKKKSGFIFVKEAKDKSDQEEVGATARDAQEDLGDHDRDEDGVFQGPPKMQRLSKNAARAKGESGSGEDPTVGRDTEGRTERGEGNRGEDGAHHYVGTPLIPGALLGPQIEVPPTPKHSENGGISMVLEKKEKIAVFGQDKDLSRKRRLQTLPSYQCSSCSLSAECPQHREGYVCAYEEAFSAFESRDLADVLASMTNILDTNRKRLLFAQLQERISGGGQIDPNVTRLSEVVMNQSYSLVELDRETKKVTLSIDPGEDPTGEKKEGILSRLFASPSVSGPLPSQIAGPAILETKILEAAEHDPELESAAQSIQRGGGVVDGVLRELDGEKLPGVQELFE